MPKKILAIFLLSLFGLASCNVSRGNQKIADRNTENKSEMINPTSGKTVLSMQSFNSYDEKGYSINVIYAVTKEGIFVQEKRLDQKSPQWKQRPLSLPSGYQNSKIINATRAEDYLYIAVDKNGSGTLKVLALNKNGKLQEVEGFPPELKVYGDKFITPMRFTDPDSFTYLVGLSKQGAPEIYRIRAEQATLVPLSNTFMNSIYPDLKKGDQVIGFVGDETQESFLVKLDLREVPEDLKILKTLSYQVWENGKDPSPLTANAQGLNIAFTHKPYSPLQDPLIITDSGEIWTISLERATGDPIRFTPAIKIKDAFAQGLNPISWGSMNKQDILMTEKGYFEIPSQSSTKKITSPTDKTTNLRSYKENKLDTYKITGVHKFMFSDVYLTTSNGIWQKDSITQKWEQI